MAQCWVANDRCVKHISREFPWAGHQLPKDAFEMSCKQRQPRPLKQIRLRKEAHGGKGSCVFATFQATPPHWSFISQAPPARDLAWAHPARTGEGTRFLAAAAATAHEEAAD